MKTKLSILASSLLASGLVYAVEADVNTQIDIQNQQRQQSQEKHREAMLDSNTTVKFDTPTTVLSLPLNESPCYPIHKISLSEYGDNKPSRFTKLLESSLKELRLTFPHCLGGEGLGVVMKQFQNRIIEQGFITTRVVAEEQDLHSGELKLTVIPGKVRNTLVQDSSAVARFTRLSAWTAMTIDTGDWLNIRDLEQSLENLKRVPTAEANIEIVPAEEGDVGLSDLKVSYQQAFPFRLTLGLDDSGSTSTGKYQGSATLSWDHLFTANDLFYTSFTHTIPSKEDDSGKRHTRNLTFHYSIPFGYWLLSLNQSENLYRQEVFGGFQNYIYSGKSRNQKATLSYVLYRDNARKTTLNGSLWARRSQTFIDGAEIEVQRRRTGGWEAGIAHKEYLGSTTLDLALNYKRGTGFHSLPAPEELFDEGTSHFALITGSIGLTVPFEGFGYPWQFRSEWEGQWNKTRLTSQDRFSIGGRYTVRGFDGELTLAGERGWYSRNELAWQFKPAHQFYLGLDYGKVYQQGEEALGSALLGTVAGLRGQLWGVNYDVFAGRPLRKPKGFRASNTVAGFNLSVQF